MAFPVTPLGVTVELQNIVSAGAWTDVTGYVYTDNGIAFTRGRSDESSGAEPGRCSFELNNRDGRFSPRNPAGAYYGKIGRNTPIRVSALVGPTRLVIPGLSDSMSAPDTAGLSITGDLDIRADVRLPNWGPNVSTRNLIQKFGTAGLRSYRLLITQNAQIQLEWSADGTSSIVISSNAALPATSGRQTVRATLDVDNGAGGNTVTFYYGPSTSGPWTQLGTPVTTAGVTSIFDSTQAIFVSGSASAAAEYYAIEVRQGINGTVRANPNFAAQSEGATSFVDGAGNTWTINNAASLTARRYRFYGEVSSWPPKWDLSGKDVRTSVEASGVLRRLGQGASALDSSYRRPMLRSATLRAYWPMEDGEGSTYLASALTGAPAMTFTGAPALATDTTSFVCSGPMLTTNSAGLTGYIPGYAGTGQGQFRFLARVPTGQATAVFARLFFSGGTVTLADLIVGNTGTLEMVLYNYVGGTLTTLATTGVWAFGVLDKSLRYSMELEQVGANINFGMVTLAPGQSTGNAVGATAAAQTLGTFAAVQFGPGVSLANVTLGHVSFEDTKTSIFDLAAVLDGYSGETAGRRIERLCDEEGIAFQSFGDLDQSVAMGVQPSATLLDLLAECEATDLGQLYESRDQLGLCYRTRDSRQYQVSSLALAYGNLAELSPVEDDQSTRNDVTVTRVGGSSSRATVDSGPLSTLAPPNGVGRYADEIEVSLQSDSQTADQAQWRATVGTVDEARYPEITAQLESPPFSASATLTDQALSVDCGDLITVSGLPAWMPPDTVRQHAIGLSETLGAFEYGISFVCVPATPYGSTGTYDDGVTRWAAGNSILNGAITSTALSAVTLTSPPVWTNNVSDFPFDIVIEGERITVSAISGATTTQTWTFSARSVNGVVKAHPNGALVELADPDYYSL